MAKFTPGPWFVRDDREFYQNHSQPFCISTAPEGDDCLWLARCMDKWDDEMRANARLMAAAPDLYAACEAADTAFAVLNIQDQVPQARACIREAWPLVQQAIAKVYPDGRYAEAVKEAQAHEIKRLDGVVSMLGKALADLVAVINLDSDQEYFICSEAAPIVEDAIQAVFKFNSNAL